MELRNRCVIEVSGGVVVLVSLEMSIELGARP